jgi:hypothetical protein
MSEAAVVDVPPHRRWLLLATIGCTLVVLGLITTALVAFDKPHFGSMVGTWFLPIITGGVFVGAILVLLAAWNLPDRTWRRWFLMIWALVAITSPALGYLFLFPWALLAITLPVVIVILSRFSSAGTSA